MSVQELLEQEILKEKDQYKDPIYRTHFRTSNFGRCYRMQYWYRQGEEVSNPIELKTLKTFRIGNLFHRDLQSLLEKEKTEVEFKAEDVFGHADHVGEDFVEDFKTVGTFPWKLMQNPKFNVDVDRESYILQLMAYCKFLGKPRGILTLINKDNYEMKTFEFKLEDWIDRVDHELFNLRGDWKRQELPYAIPRAYNRKDCNYCPFQFKCDKVEGNTAKERYELTKPQKAKVF